MADSQIRQTAYKVWIADLANNEYINPEGEWVPSYVQVKDLKVSRVNIVANIIMKYQNEDSSYVTLTLDDGSENIPLKAWNEDTKLFEGIEIGNMVLTIARVREYNGKVYLVPEIIRKLNKPEWMILRKKELIKEFGEKTERTPQQTSVPISEVVQESQSQPQSPSQPVIEEEQVVEETVKEAQSTGHRQKILDIIGDQDSGEGVEIVQIASKTNIDEQETSNLIQELLKEGEIFEIKPGKIKLIE
jgi:RPA family protein